MTAIDPNLHDMVLIDQLPSDAWSEGLVIRPSGNVLTTRIETPEIHGIDINASSPTINKYGEVAPQLLHTFPDAGSTWNICPIPDAEGEEYAVLTGFADLQNNKFYGFALWRVVMPAEGSSEPLQATKITDIEDAGYLLGITPVSGRNIIVCDAVKGRMLRVDMTTGNVSKLIEDEAFLAPPNTGFGAHRVRFSAGYGWFVNTSAATIGRFPIEYVDDGKDIRVTGKVQEIASGLENMDGLAVTPDGKSIYVVSYVSGHLWRVDVDVETGESTVNTLRSDLVCPTAVELVYSEGRKEPVLYILCCGFLDSSWLDSERGNWLEIAKVDRSKLEIRVTVTTEVTYEYI